MPNMKNAKKKVKVNIKKTASNNDYEATMKNAIKKVEKAVAAKDNEKAKEKLGFKNRNMKVTIKDTVEWINKK